MISKTRKSIFFQLNIIFLLLPILFFLNFEAKNSSRDLFSTDKRNIILEECDYKYLSVPENYGFEIRYFELDFYRNLGNIKCINSITSIEFDNKVVYVAKSTQLDFIFYFFYIFVFFLGKYRFKLLYTFYILKLISDFYIYGLSDFGYPYLIPLLILFYAYEK